MIKLFVADNNELIRSGLKNIFENEHDLRVVGEAKSYIELMEKISHSKCSILILDMNMSGISGFELITEIKSKCPKLSILVLSNLEEEKYAVRILKAGANGFITKDSKINDLLIAVRKIYKQGKYFSDKITDQVIKKLNAENEILPHEKLSNRELDILCLISSGRSTREIANKLSLSISVINNYRNKIFEKLNLKNNIELIHYTRQNHLTENNHIFSTS